MSKKYRHQGFVLHGGSQEGVELELNFSSLNEGNNQNNGHQRGYQNSSSGKQRQANGADSYTMGEDSLYSIASADSWEIEEKFDALKQIKKKKTIVEFHNEYNDDEGSYDDSYYDNDRSRIRAKFVQFRKWFIAGGLFLVLTAIAIGLSVHFTQSNGNNGEMSGAVSEGPPLDNDPSPAPPVPPVPDIIWTEGMTEREQEVFEVLKRVTPPEILTDKSTPQSVAFNFVSNEDPLFISAKEDSETLFRLRQRYILSSIYYSSNGGNWTESHKWLNGGSECDWHGITCTDDFFITMINLKSNNLVGELVPELGKLEKQHLVKIVVDHNHLKGTLPEEIHHLHELMQFELDDNSFTGSIPEALFRDLKRLRRLEMQYNQFSGEIPTSVGLLEGIEKLHLYSNSLTGSIPEEIGLCLNLEKLTLDRNNLNGTLPGTLFSLSNLETLSLSKNSISGILSPKIGDLVNLKEISLKDNLFSGYIPSEISHLSSLEYLELQINDLTGAIPKSIGALSSLYHFSVYNNILGGTIPEEFYALTSLKHIDLTANYFSGSISSKIGDLDDLINIYYGENLLDGSIPEEIGYLSALEVLDLHGNYISGHIPDTLDGLKNMTEFVLFSNDITGSIPYSLFHAESLEILALSANKIEGHLSSRFDDLVNLREIYLWDNMITGTLPDDFANLEFLEHLEFNNNEITGRVPDEICEMNLETLYADCKGIHPEVSCTCCTVCWN